MNKLVYAFTYHSTDTFNLRIAASDMLEAFMLFREHKDGEAYLLLEIKLIGKALSDF
jgi:hypothetical protein